LVIRGDHLGYECGAVGLRCISVLGEAAEIVDTFKDDEPVRAGLGEDVAIEAGEGIGAEAVGEEVVAADAEVEDGDVARGGRGLEACGEDVGPAIVTVGGGGVPVGDGVAEGDDCGCERRGENVDAGELIPVFDMLRVRKVGCGDEVAVEVPRGGVGAGVSGFGGRRRVKMEGDGEARERRDGAGDGVGEIFSAGGDEDVGGSRKSYGAIGCGVNCGGVECERVRDVHGCDVERRGPKRIRQADAERGAADGEVDDLADGGVAEIVGRDGILGLGNLDGSGPGAGPGLLLSVCRTEREECDGGGEKC